MDQTQDEYREASVRNSGTSWDTPEANPLQDLQRARLIVELEGRDVEFAARVLLEQTTGWKDDKHGHDTPKRFTAMLRELTTPEHFSFTTFPVEDQDMVIVKAIPFVSVCNHHVVPYTSTVSACRCRRG